MDKKYQIFISSTFTDLQEERSVVQEAIYKLYQIPIGMEAFSANAQDQWETIQKTLETTDYYILIVGNRYGSLIEEGEWKGISYTEREYRYAIKSGIPVLAFLISEEAMQTKDKMEQNADKLEKLKAFKQDVCTGRMVEWWKDKEELSNKVSIAVAKQIFEGARPGWIRADKIDIEKSNTEMVKLLERVNILEEENKRLRNTEQVRYPKFYLKLNQRECITIPFQEVNDIDIIDRYHRIELDEIPSEMTSEITPEVVEAYNNQLPSDEEIENYRKKMAIYRRMMDKPFDIDFTIGNDGDCKANDIYVEIEFPDELIVYPKDDISDYPIPKEPACAPNPIDECYRKLATNIASAASIDFEKTFGRLPRLNSVLSNIDSPRRYYYHEDDNSISIRMDNLMNEYTWSIRKEFVVVPLQKGRFKITCWFKCEELQKSQRQDIEVVVE